MITSESRPFTAATNKLAFAQAFAGPTAHRRNVSRGPRLARRLAGFRRARRS